MKVLGFGPPGLVADVLPDVLGRAGHELVEVGPDIADQLMQVDALVLWIPPVCVDWGMLDEMHSMLAILRFGKLGQSVKHVVLISSVTSWAATDTRGLIGGDTLAKGGLTEDDYALRQPMRGCAEGYHLEEQVLAMSTPSLLATVVGAGLLYGAGEESLYPIFRDAWLQHGEIALPCYRDGSQRIPTCHVATMCALVCALLQSKQAPKPYVLAVEASHIETESARERESESKQHDERSTSARSRAIVLQNTSPPQPEQSTLREITLALHAATDVPGGTFGTLTPPTIRPLGAEEYAEALVAEPALGALSLDLTFNVASSALSAYAADGAVYPRPDGLVAGAAAVMAEFASARRLEPNRVWVLRPAGATKEMCRCARYLSRRYVLPLVDARTAVEWAHAHASPRLFGADGADLTAPAEAGGERIAPEAVDVQKMAPLARRLLLAKRQLAPLADPEAPWHEKVPRELALECVALRLKSCDAVARGYVLDGLPESPEQLKDLFTIEAAPEGVAAGGDAATEAERALDPDFAPSAVVVVKVCAEGDEPSVGDGGTAFRALQARDWRWQPPAEGGSGEGITASLQALLSIDVCELRAREVGAKNLGPRLDPVSAEQVGWKQRARAAVEGAYESEIAPGHLSLELSSEGLLPFEDDDDEGEPAEAGAAPVVVDVAPGATTASDDVATVAAEPGNVIKSARERRAAEAQHNEYEDLSSRSGLLRDYMMTHVMPVVTQGLLECLKTRPEDATDFMADYLTVEAKKRVRAHEARHFLAFQASAAKLKELQDEEDRLAELEDAED